jgi:hypothetical protein
VRDCDDVKDALERNRNEKWLFNGDVFKDYRASSRSCT